MADEEKKLVQWDNKIGMATVTGVIQIVALVVTVAIAFNSVREAVDNSRLAVNELKNIVATLQTASSLNAERITRVEEQSKSMSNSLDRIERKVDQLSTSAPKR